MIFLIQAVIQVFFNFGYTFKRKTVVKYSKIGTEKVIEYCNFEHVHPVVFILMYWIYLKY
jgi:hypothetical protein